MKHELLLKSRITSNSNISPVPDERTVAYRAFILIWSNSFINYEYFNPLATKVWLVIGSESWRSTDCTFYLRLSRVGGVTRELDVKSPLQTAMRTWSLDDSLPLATALGCCCCCWSVKTRSFSALGVRLRSRGLMAVDDVITVSVPPTSRPPIRTRKRVTCSTPGWCKKRAISRC